MIEAARLKARAPIALGDCFAVTTASAHNLALLTGDPEIIELTACPCHVEDLRLAATMAMSDRSSRVIPRTRAACVSFQA